MKQRLGPEVITMRIAKEFKDGSVVNLGYGLPTLCSMYIPESIRVIFHSENGILGYGAPLTTDEREQWDPCVINASAQFVAKLPGMSFFNCADAFGMIRGGHIDLAVLGGLQVSERGDLANWTMPGRSGGMGGAMDLAASGSRIIVGMEHNTRSGEAKIMNKCTYPLTATECVNLIVTDLAVIEVTKKGLLLKEIAPGWTIDEVQELTEPNVIVSNELKEIEL
ncbi:3-oxoacid CoA-transferase subunit B [Chloroflexota bacterium]